MTNARIISINLAANGIVHIAAEGVVQATKATKVSNVCFPASAVTLIEDAYHAEGGKAVMIVIGAVVRTFDDMDADDICQTIYRV